MADKYCPFLVDNKSGGLFSASFRCAKRNKAIYHNEPLYKEYCANYEDCWSKCPYFKADDRRRGW